MSGVAQESTIALEFLDRREVVLAPGSKKGWELSPKLYLQSRYRFHAFGMTLGSHLTGCSPTRDSSVSSASPISKAVVIIFYSNIKGIEYISFV